MRLTLPGIGSIAKNLAGRQEGHAKLLASLTESLEQQRAVNLQILHALQQLMPKERQYGD